jgi:hypothetical protein
MCKGHNGMRRIRTVWYGRGKMKKGMDGEAEKRGSEVGKWRKEVGIGMSDVNWEGREDEENEEGKH